MANLRLPNELLKAKGTYRPCRHGEHDKTLDVVEVSQLPLLLDPPEYLSEEEATEWKIIVGWLNCVGVLKMTDQATLENYCRMRCLIRATPIEQVTAALMGQFRALCNELGLTPMARSKIRLDTKYTKANNPYTDL